MADLIFLFHRKFRCGFTQIWQKKMGVVAETAFPARFQNDLAVPCAVSNNGLRVIGMAHQHDYAVIVSLAIGLAP